ncbi:MAG TPA: histidinol-phosphate transaminase [Salegentibacter sp.]|uniref:histidinol-phosphate transaminase n=1 Tax=Salegentibacter sp. TaxID=1903072 RepID=UPI002F936509
MRDFNIKKLVRANVVGLKPYSSARDEYKAVGEEMIFLDANENPFSSDVNRYPDPQQRNLKAQLAKIKGIPVESILLGNGSDEVLDLLFRAFCEPGTDNVISLPPTYGMYSVLAGINNVENREVLLDSNFQPNVPEILEKVDANTKMIFLCSPNNPSGNSFASDKVEEILMNFKGLVVIDEAYIDFSEKESWLQRLNNFPNLVITQTLSKAYGLAAIRLGILYASEEIISILNRIKPPYNVNQLTQERALEELKDQEKLNTQVAVILKERAKLNSALKGVDLIKEIYESDANFILVKVDDANKRYEQLIEKGIVVRNRSSQPLCESTLRLTVGTKSENEKLLNALKSLN